VRRGAAQPSAVSVMLISLAAGGTAARIGDSRARESAQDIEILH
jgi:hypothetical protein